MGTGKYRNFNNSQLQDSPNANFEKFYIDELEKKLEAHRQHETKLASDLQVAQTFVKDLQEENKSFLRWFSVGIFKDKPGYKSNDQL